VVESLPSVFEALRLPSKRILIGNPSQLLIRLKLSFPKYLEPEVFWTLEYLHIHKEVSWGLDSILSMKLIMFHLYHKHTAER
jgi:hypothetical protein